MEETIKVLYNNCYGGYGVSKKALELYNKRTGYVKQEYEIKRHDPVLVEIYNELGNEFNAATYSKIKVEEIPKKYENYYEIHEYDGLEHIRFDIYKYKVERIKDILKEEKEDKNKLEEIELLLEEQ
jgi:hypothetical protein